MSEPTNCAGVSAGPADLMDRHGLAALALDEVPGMAIVVFDRGMRVRLAGGDAIGVEPGARDDLVGRRVRDVLPAAVALAAIPHCRNALAGRESTCVIRSRDGQTAFVVSAL